MKISYEDADQQVQTRTFPIKLQAEEMVPGTTIPTLWRRILRRDPWLWIGLGGAVPCRRSGGGDPSEKSAAPPKAPGTAAGAETEETTKEEA